MRVVRGKTIEITKNTWEKIEIELDAGDLLPEEQEAHPQVQPQLLELRAERHLILFLHRSGIMSQDNAKASLAELEVVRKKLLKNKAPVQLKARKKDD